MYFFVPSAKAISFEPSGKCFSIWRYLQNYEPVNQRADLYINLNTLVTPNIDQLFSFYKDKINSNSNTFLTSLKRLSDLYFPPVTLNIWINEFGDLVKDETILEVLNKPYSKYNDREVSKKFWLSLSSAKNFPFINQNWKNNLEVIIKKSKIFTLENNKVKNQINSSIKSLKANYDFQNLQHKARIKKLDASRVNFENLNIDFDNRVNILFQEAISKPKIDFFSVGIIFLSNKNFSKVETKTK